MGSVQNVQGGEGGGTRVQAERTRAQAERGGGGGSPRADGHSLMKRWRWPCQLSPRPWTNGCLTCLWGYKAERVSGPWMGGFLLVSPPPPPFSPLTWMLTSSLHCLRVSRRSTSTLGTTWKRGRQDGGGFCGSTEPPGCGAALTFTAQTFSLPQSNTFRMVPKEPLATKPRI